MSMQSGIYQIVNVKNGKSYVGSAVDLCARWKQHKQKLKEQIASRKFQNAWNKYGKENFEFLILEYCSYFELEEREQFWIDWLNTHKNGYNTRFIANSNVGIKLSEEARINISKANKGRKLSEEAKRNISNSLKGNTYTKGRKLSKEHRKKLRLSWINRPHGPNKGKTFSQEWKENLSKSHKGRSAPNKGTPHSEEHKEKIRLGIQKIPSNRRREIATQAARVRWGKI